MSNEKSNSLLKQTSQDMQLFLHALQIGDRALIAKAEEKLSDSDATAMRCYHDVCRDPEFAKLMRNLADK